MDTLLRSIGEFAAESGSEKYARKPNLRLWFGLGATAGLTFRGSDYFALLVMPSLATMLPLVCKGHYRKELLSEYREKPDFRSVASNVLETGVYAVGFCAAYSDKLMLRLCETSVGQSLENLLT